MQLQFFCPCWGWPSAIRHALSKDALDRLLLRRWIQMSIAASLLLGLVPDEIIDEPLIDSAAGKRRNEAVPQDVPAAHYLPSAGLHGSLESLLHCSWVQHLGAAAEQEI